MFILSHLSDFGSNFDAKVTKCKSENFVRIFEWFWDFDCPNAIRAEGADQAIILFAVSAGLQVG